MCDGLILIHNLHEIEENGPHGSQWHLSQALGIDDESQSRSRLHHVFNSKIGSFRHEADNGEDGETTENRSTAIDE